MNTKNKFFVVDNLIGFLFISNVSDILGYCDEIDKNIESRVISSLAIICTEEVTKVNIDYEQKKDIYSWLNLLSVPTFAVIKGSCKDMLELIMTCDIRLCEKSSTITFPDNEDEFVSNFVEKCQLLMGKGRSIDEYKALLSLTIESEEAYRLRLINQVIDTENLVNSVKKYIHSVLFEKSNYQIRAIMKCINNYKLHGINSDRELLLEQESKQFCNLILKEYKKSRS